MSAKRPLEDRSLRAFSELVDLQLAAQNRERILAQISADREARQAAKSRDQFAPFQSATSVGDRTDADALRS